MIYGEVLSAIDEDEFLVAGDRTLERAPRLDAISQSERQSIATEFRALSGLSFAVALKKLTRLAPRQGKRYGIA